MPIPKSISTASRKMSLSSIPALYRTHASGSDIRFNGWDCHTKAAWQIMFPVTDFPKWLSFNRLQQERFPDHGSTFESVSSRTFLEEASRRSTHTVP